MLVKKEIIVSEEVENKRLDLFLAETFKHIPRNQWQNRIKQGIVLVNNRKVKNSYQIKKNDVISFFYSIRPEPQRSITIRVLYEDRDLLILDKPPDVPVHPSGNYRTFTLHTHIKEKLKYDYCHPINRLDRETSGIILFGKNPYIIKAMQSLFEQNQILKIYHVLIFGNYHHSSMIDGYIGKDFLSPIHIKHRFIPLADIEQMIQSYKNDYTPNTESFSFFVGDQTYVYKYAKTEFHLIKTKKISHSLFTEISLVKVVLHTGRTHQIRATLSSLGYPIVGDKIYGPSEEIFLKFLNNQFSEKEQKLIMLTRTGLHCSEIRFIHPVNQKQIKITSELPEDFRQVLEN
ncbi:MAG: RluA family pseudouridine synthase [Leptospiraceae bacterium]|nr:RluA family pseudouridine synthase [Leptospiraceae bacterium]